MIIEKKVAVKLTDQEYSILTHCEEIIDGLIDQMRDFNLKECYTDYDSFNEGDLNELANKIHSLKTVIEAD